MNNKTQPNQQAETKVYRTDTFAGAKEWAEHWVERRTQRDDKTAEQQTKQAGSPS